MGRGVKLTAICLLVAAVTVAGMAFAVYAQEETSQQVQSISVSGEVVSVGLEKSEVVVKQLKDVAYDTYENTVISIGPETKIQKGEVVLNISDLNAGDKIIVQCVTGAEAKLEAQVISVSE